MRHFRSLAALIFGVCFLVYGSGSAARADDAADTPTIVKDRVIVSAATISSYQKDFKVWSWLPRLSLRVNGPIASGGVLWAEFKLPTGPWVKFDINTQETQKGHWWNVKDAGGNNIGEDKASTYTGPVAFTIHLRNELAGTDATLFSGNFKVNKAHSTEVGPTAVDHFVFYVDQDWNMPIGYVFYSADDVHGMKLPGFHAAFWMRGDTAPFEPHLFYQGKEVGKVTLSGEQVGKPSAVQEFEVRTTQDVDRSIPERAIWQRIVCTFPNVKGWNDTGQPITVLPGAEGAIFILKENPGEYELKVIRNGKLARNIKFTVRPDGKFDDSITTANKIGENRAVVPVKILDDQDGNWNKEAWKTDAFYGNPLTGFTE